jgi:proteasome lid subunit RPN8/RPN11
MSFENSYLAVAELLDEKGKSIYHWELKNFRNCIEDIKFSAFIKGICKNDGIEPLIYLEPIWEKPGVTPYCFQFKLTLENTKYRYSKPYGVNVFKYQIWQVLIQLLNSDSISKDQKLNFRLAFINHLKEKNVEEGEKTSKLKVSSINSPLPILKHSLKQFNHSKESKNMDQDPGLLVFLPEHIVQEMIDDSMKNHVKEVAGFLLGHLYQDPDSDRLFVVCNAQLLANGVDLDLEKTQSSSLTHFQFSPETFLKAEAMLRLRNKKEILIGWWHSHPWIFSCEKCKKEDSCDCSSLFFSNDDVAVMEAAFSLPYQIAIVIGGTSENPQKAVAQMYGWKDGLIISRDFETIPYKAE